MLCMKILNKMPLHTFRYFCFTSNSCIFLQNLSIPNSEISIAWRAHESSNPSKKWHREWQWPGARVFDGVIFPLFLGARIKDKFLQSRIVYNLINIFVCRSGSRNLVWKVKHFIVGTVWSVYQYHCFLLKLATDWKTQLAEIECVYRNLT